jgi:hypothetical protein
MQQLTKLLSSISNPIRNCILAVASAVLLVSCGGGGVSTSALLLSVFAGNTNGAGNIDGTGAAASFNYPTGVATDASGNVYVADTDNHTIRKITREGVVTTLAGTAGTRGSADGTGAAASIDSPNGVATDASGNVYLADAGNNTIRKITPAGVVTTLAGTAGVGGFQPGALPGVIYSPSAIAVSGSKIYFSSNNGIVVIK